ncbi:5730_t:CDS:1, partial [Funneliformis caledonium]
YEEDRALFVRVTSIDLVDNEEPPSWRMLRSDDSVDNEKKSTKHYTNKSL